MKRICVTCAVKLVKPIENDEMALVIFDLNHSIVTSDMTCEMKRCISRADKLMRDVRNTIEAL